MSDKEEKTKAVKHKKGKTKRSEKKDVGSKKEKNKDDLEVQPVKPRKPKKMKKSIYISHSSDATFVEKRFVVDLVQQVKENNLAEDIWFDKDEGIIDSSSWLSTRLENTDKCRAIVFIFSRDFMTCPITVYERKIIMERISHDDEAKKPQVFCVILEQVQFTQTFAECLLSVNAVLVDLTGDLAHLSIEEKTSYAVGALFERLDKIATVKSPYMPPPIQNESKYNEDWKRKRVIAWNCTDVVEWLYSIHVREFYRHSFAEQRVDGYLLLATRDSDLQWLLGVDSRIVRKKILSELMLVLKSEEKYSESWHLRYRLIRPRRDSIYLIYDPQDARLASNIKTDLSRRGLQVLSHDKLGQSREEFLQLNGGSLAKCSYAICLMTEAASTSPFVFHEVLFSYWLGGDRSLLTLLFSNSWNKLKNSMKATMGDSPAIDFEKKLYSESMSILEHHIKPQPNLTGVVLEQKYLEQMTEGVQTLKSICFANMTNEPNADESIIIPKIFISYQWDVQGRVLEIADFLESNDLPCWSDVTMTPRSSTSRMAMRQNKSQSTADAAQVENLQTHIHRNMKLSKVVVCCLTPKYVHCQNCEQDMLLASSLGKPVLPVMLQFVTWPPEGASERVRKMMTHLPRPVDLSTDKLFKANLPQFLDKVVRFMS
ncbi:uncharacterized protein LOC100186349 [Ciona intestinalis]